MELASQQGIEVDPEEVWDADGWGTCLYLPRGIQHHTTAGVQLTSALLSEQTMALLESKLDHLKQIGLFCFTPSACLPDSHPFHWQATWIAGLGVRALTIGS